MLSLLLSIAEKSANNNQFLQDMSIIFFAFLATLLVFVVAGAMAMIMGIDET